MSKTEMADKLRCIGDSSLVVDLSLFEMRAVYIYSPKTINRAS